VATHGRLLDRHRLNVLLGKGSGDALRAALDAYGNEDGGYGWGLEPDLRSATSQPVAAMHALEILAEVPDAGSRPVRLLDWLAGHTRPDGGVPFGLPFTDTEGCAPHWAAADPAASSLQMTAQLAARAYRVGRGRPDVAGHPWLAGATAYCLDAIEGAAGEPHAYEVMFALHFLDGVAATQPRAEALIDRLTAYVVPDGPTPVAGGAPGEGLHPLDFTPVAGGPVRAAFPAAAVAADLARLAHGQQSDGGWTVGFPVYSAAAELEWRAYATIQALITLGAL
jgi:hypothetical protein